MTAPARHPSTPAAGIAPGSTTEAGWHGRLALHYRNSGGRTVAHDRHHGPLRVLKSMHPEGPAICHHVLVHPPGGIVGGDTLDIDVSLAPQTHALITTPGATRFYRSAGATATQRVDVVLAEDARFEWLPMETLAHPGTRARNTMSFALAPGAEMIGWDLLCLGLPAAGERFDSGIYEQSLHVSGDWRERGVIDAGDPVSRRLMSSPLGLDGHPCLATLWCAAGADWSATRRETLLTAVREVLDASAGTLHCGATAPSGRVIVVRALAHRIEPLWGLAKSLRDTLRAVLWGLDPARPRIWSS